MCTVLRRLVRRITQSTTTTIANSTVLQGNQLAYYFFPFFISFFLFLLFIVSFKQTNLYEGSLGRIYKHYTFDQSTLNLYKLIDFFCSLLPKKKNCINSKLWTCFGSLLNYFCWFLQRFFHFYLILFSSKASCTLTDLLMPPTIVKKTKIWHIRPVLTAIDKVKSNNSRSRYHYFQNYFSWIALGQKEISKTNGLIFFNKQKLGRKVMKKIKEKEKEVKYLKKIQKFRFFFVCFSKYVL